MFTKKTADTTPINDNVFPVVSKAMQAIKQHGKDNVINASIGALFDENEELVAYNSVFGSYNSISNKVKAAYASSFSGNENYKSAYYNWIIGNRLDKLSSKVIATMGGTGAVACAFMNLLDEKQTVILPDIAWGSYFLMAKQNNLNYTTYDVFDFESFKNACLTTINNQDKLVVVINDPAHNPTGYSMLKQQWKQVIDFINECSTKVPCVIVNDVAYIDYLYQPEHTKQYIDTFNDISDQVMIIMAVSTSKTLTSYGLRCGAAIILAQNEDSTTEVENVFEKTARAVWSNIPNAAMENLVEVFSTHKESYLAEKQIYVDLLKQRSDLFLNEAKQCGLIHYPYHDGFFITIKITDLNLCDQYHQTLMNNNIFTVKVNKGIRVAICSVNLAHLKGLAFKMKQILDSIQ